MSPPGAALPHLQRCGALTLPHRPARPPRPWRGSSGGSGAAGAAPRTAPVTPGERGTPGRPSAPDQRPARRGRHRGRHRRRRRPGRARRTAVRAPPGGCRRRRPRWPRPPAAPGAGPGGARWDSSGQTSTSMSRLRARGTTVCRQRSDGLDSTRRTRRSASRATRASACARPRALSPRHSSTPSHSSRGCASARRSSTRGSGAGSRPTGRRERGSRSLWAALLDLCAHRVLLRPAADGRGRFRNSASCGTALTSPQKGEAGASSARDEAPAGAQPEGVEEAGAAGALPRGTARPARGHRTSNSDRKVPPRAHDAVRRPGGETPPSGHGWAGGSCAAAGSPPGPSSGGCWSACCCRGWCCPSPSG